MKRAHAKTADRSPLEVVAGVIFKGRRLLVASRCGDDPLAGKWEFPGGKIEIGETPQSCLVRELKEELGIDVRPGRLIGTTEHKDSGRTIRLTFCEAFYERGDMTLTVHDRAEWILPEELRNHDLAPADEGFVDQLLQFIASR